MKCLETSCVAGPCCECGVYQMREIHIYADIFYCEQHCPEHGRLAHLEEGEAITITGEQEGFF